MAVKHRNIAYSEAEYTRCLEKIRGISAVANPSSESNRFGMLENMYVDYEGAGEAVESIPGFRRLISFDMKINGIFNQTVDGDGEYLIIHAGKYICRFKKDELDGAQLTTAIATMKDTKSRAFSFGDALYLIDGESILKINQDGEAFKIGYDGLSPYIPTLYRDFEPYEKRNLLTSRARESYRLKNPSDFIYGTPELNYAITDEKNRLCCVIGGKNVTGAVHIPSFAKINGVKYTVNEIMGYAFANNENITSLVSNPGLKIIGAGAFSGCKNLTSVILSCTVDTVYSKAFAECSSLSELHLNKFPLNLAPNSFSGNNLQTVKCSGNLSDFKTTTAGSGLEEKNPVFEPLYTKLTLGFTAHGPVNHVDRVLLTNIIVEHNYHQDSKTAIVVFENEEKCKGQELILETSLYDGSKISYNDEDDFLATADGLRVSGIEAIFGCTICEGFDGRIFLSGNPKLPGVVFYSEPDSRRSHQPLYFKTSNFFIDGIANIPVTALLSTHGMLAVFREKDDGAGTIIYHERKSDSKGISYPATYHHGSIPAYGPVANFFDEALFLTERGICALEKTDTSSFKEVKCRSELINPLLLKENLRSASLTEWQGYLVVALGENLYLADSRDSYKKDGILQYEWYRLTGIGAYKNDTRVFRYSDERIEGYDNSESVGEVASGIAYSELSGGKTVYFVNEGDKKILVYKTEEFTGGELDACHVVFSDGKNLYFGTEGGELCMFNTDKRGVAPSELSESENFSAEEYKIAMGNKIHPSFYSFDRHAARYGVSTASDNCEIPYLTKSTVRNSLAVKFKVFENTTVTAEVETDNGGRRSLGVIPLSSLSFECVDFSGMSASLSDYSTITIPESERGWTEKRLAFRSNSFCSPFGVYSISYRYKIKGKIK